MTAKKTKKNKKQPIGFQHSLIKKDETPIDRLHFVDLTKFKPNKYVVKVNDQQTDLNIGDAIYLEGEDNSPKVMTIGGIIVNSEGNISYLCEMNNGMDIVSQTYSIADLQRLQYRF